MPAIDGENKSFEFAHNLFGIVIGDFTSMQPRERVQFSLQQLPGDRLEALQAVVNAPPAEPARFLRVGDKIRIALKTEIPGFLHVFNFGISGRCAKLFPLHGRSNVRISPTDQWSYLTSNQSQGLSDGVERAFAFPELGDRLGSANGKPEELFALVMEKDVAVDAKDLHPNLQWVDSGYRGPSGTVSRRLVQLPRAAHLFQSKFGDQTWAWGHISIQVEPSIPRCVGNDASTLTKHIHEPN